MSSATDGPGRKGGQAEPSLSQVPAQDQDAERAVLGALLLYGDPRQVLKLVRRLLTPECFWWSYHGDVFAAAVSLAKRQVDVDGLTVLAEMERLGTRTESTKALLDDLHGWVPVAGNVSHYADRVVEQARWRERLRTAYSMLEAIGKRDNDAWLAQAAVFVPDDSKELTGSTVLRLVDGAGQVVGEQMTPCEACKELQDQLTGAQTEIKGWRARYANLERDVEKAAREDAWWLPAQALFEHWKKSTGHKNSKWTSDRFYACEPYLKKYGVVVFERAIAGIAHDPYTKLRRNGTRQRYDSWETLCKSAGAVEEYANRAPKGWKVTLKITVEAEPQAPQLAVVS